PSVQSTSPTNGATDVALNATITVNFSESVSATTSSFTLECPTGTSKTYALTSSPASRFTLTPTASLPGGTVCTVTVVAAQVHDADTGDPPDGLAANYVFSFSTVDTAPSVTTTVPVDTATHVATNATITVNWDEPVTVSTSSFTLECPTGVS